MVGASESFIGQRSFSHGSLAITAGTVAAAIITITAAVAAAAVAAATAATATAAATAATAIAAISQSMKLVEVIAEVIVILDANTGWTWNQHRIGTNVAHRWASQPNVPVTVVRLLS